MKKKAYDSNDSASEILYDTSTGGLVRTKDNNQGLWMHNEPERPRITIAYKAFVPDLCPILSPQHAIIAITNYGDYERNLDTSQAIERVVGTEERLYLIYTQPSITLYELDLINLISNGLTAALLSKNPSTNGTNFLVTANNNIDEFRPPDSDFILDSPSTANLLSYGTATDYNGSNTYSIDDFVPLYPYISSREVSNNNNQINRAQLYGAPIFSENGTNYLSPKIYRDMAVCEYFSADTDSQHLGLGRLVVNLRYSLFGESLRGYSVGSNLFWPPLTSSSRSAKLVQSPLSTLNYNAGGLNYVCRYYEFNDSSPIQYIGSEFSIFNNSGPGRSEGLIQFRWNYWNQGPSSGTYPAPGPTPTPLPALDKSSELRNFPDFPRQINYNIPACWIPSEANVSRGTGSNPFFFINSSHLSLDKSNATQKLKIFASRDCTVNLSVSFQSLISNYASSSTRIFNSETFFFWSSPGPYNLTAGEIREITISVAPQIRSNTPATLKSNRYSGSYILSVGDLDDSDGQITYLDVTYLPKYDLSTCRLLKCIAAGGLHKRNIYNEDLNYIVELQNYELEFQLLSSDNLLVDLEAEVIVEKVLGDIDISIDSTLTFERASKSAFLSISADLLEEQFAYVTISLNFTLNSQTVKKKYSFQVLPQQTLLSQDFFQTSTLYNFNNNDIYVYFEKSDSETVSLKISSLLESPGGSFSLDFEEGYERFFNVDLSTDSASGNSTLTLTRASNFESKDFFVKGWLTDSSSSLRIFIYVTNFYPCTNNFKPILFS